MDKYPNNGPNWEKVLAVLNHELPEVSTALEADEQALLSELKEIKEASELFMDLRFDAESKIEAISQRLNFKQKPIKRSLWPRIAVAAAAVATIVFGVWFYTSRLDTTRHPELVSGSQDIDPGKQGATLTLASGKKIRLTDAGNGELAEEAGVEISKSADGQLLYKIKGDKAEANKINTLSTAKGETYIVTLPDNSKVWLNAASSLTYSATLREFGARRVKLEGEAYFEVAKDKAHPFIVQTAKQEVEVLGTHFNVNAYTDEPAIATTLLEGSVKVTVGKDQKLLKPGEQALNSGKAILVAQANTENITDWKNGDFYLDNVNFKTAMRKIARWYNVDVIYDRSVSDNMETGGWISRKKKLSEVLKLIASSGQVHFKIEGAKVFVYEK